MTYEDISMGIFAPTIRYHDGIYYEISTNMTTHENFICTASGPAGAWSDPHVLKNVDGIDPSLFYDEDGKVFYWDWRRIWQQKMQNHRKDHIFTKGMAGIVL